VTGDVMTVSNTTLAVDAGLSPREAKLVRRGMRVRIEDAETGIDLRGRVSRIAARPGTNQQLTDPTKTNVEVTPVGADKRLVNTSVRLRIAIKSTAGKVLTVPINALSVGGDGRSRVQVDIGGGRTRIVPVTPGLAAAGIVEVEPKQPGALKAGDRVVIGTDASASAARAPTGSRVPAAPAGVSTTPAPSQTPSGAGSAPQSTTPAGPTATTPSPAGRPAPSAAGENGPTGTPSGTRGP
jgi:hypothetical protein